MMSTGLKDNNTPNLSGLSNLIREMAPRENAPPWDISAYMQKRRQQQIAEQLINTTMEQQKQAQLQAAKDKQIGLEVYWTPEEMQEFTKMDDAERRVQTDPNYSNDEKGQLANQIQSRRQYLISNPHKRPIDPSKPQYPPGREPGQIWEGMGGFYATALDAHGNLVPKLMIREDQTTKYAVEVEKAKAETKTVQGEYEFKNKVLLEQIPLFNELGQKTGIRFYNDEEIANRMEIYKKAHMTEQQKMEIELTKRVQARKAQEQQFQQQTQMQVQFQRAAQAQVNDMASKGWKITVEDKMFPPNIISARVLLRHLLELSKGDLNNLSVEDRQTAEQAAWIIENYKRSQK